MTIKDLKKKAAELRCTVVKMIGAGRKGHYGGSLSSADIVAALYFHKMNIDPSSPDWPERDRFVLSKGHASFVQYAALALRGYFPTDELMKAKQLGSMLQGHPDMNRTPGVECNTGSLAQGISQAAGMAAGLRLDGSDAKVYCIVGDGELGEGLVWEAAMSAYNFRLGNLVCIMDRNGFCAMGPLAERYDIGDVRAKFDAFGWHTIEIDGHDMKQIVEALDDADKITALPVMIIAHTVKGKGVGLAENQTCFHNGVLENEDFNATVCQLEDALK